MKQLITLLVFLFITAFAFGQNEKLMQVINDQFDAFNKADVDRLVNNVTDDFKWFFITSDSSGVEVEGKDNFRKSMEDYFKKGRKVTSKMESFVIHDNRISFKEVVSHKNSKGEMVSSSAMGIYEIRGDKISRAWYFY
ncbi:MAG TPA: nuclear transport factor 2 family protein [Chitinophagaceae bacterium]|nr:nuclear transport factor 2 family protein [Chitinophagaceae bacterium]